MRSATRLLSVPLQGIVLYIAGLWLLSSLDASSKYLTSLAVPVLVVAWFRYVGHVLLMTALVMPRVGPKALLATQAPVRQALRGALMLSTTLLFFTLLRHAPIAQATVFNFLAPLLILAISPWLLREPARWHRWLGVALGISGMLLIVRPGGSLAPATTALGLLTAASFAGFLLATRGVARDAALTTNFYGGLLGAVVLTLALPWFWKLPDLSAPQWALLLSTGVTGFLSHGLQIMGFRRAPASTLAPFTYLQIVAATLLGWWVFGQWPDLLTAAGMALIGAAGLGVGWLESRASRQATVASSS